jgi:hypothetical protein
MILSNRNNLKIGLTMFATVLIALMMSVVDGGVFELTDFPSQHPAIETLRTEFFQSRKMGSDWDKMSLFYRTFYQTRTTGSVQVLPKKEPMSYNLWLQAKPAELVVVLPGLGAHYSSVTATAFAELLHRSGYSVVVISNAMNWQFMEQASRAKVPGFTPADAADVYNALKIVIQQVDKLYPGKITGHKLMGYSLGALHTLFISDIEYGVKQPLFNRYLAISPPVDVFYAMNVIDRYYMVAAKWDKVAMDRHLKKAIDAYMELVTGRAEKNKKIELDADEAKFLIGESFHLILTDIIYSIYRCHKLGIIKAQYSWYNREEIYAEIGRFSYKKYLEQYLLKVYSAKFKRKITIGELSRKSSLIAIGNSLASNQAVRVLHTRNDFLLKPADIQWLTKTLGERLTLFSDGGHLGNFYLTDVQHKIIELLKIEKK